MVILVICYIIIDTKDDSIKRKSYILVVAVVYILFGIYFYNNPIILKNSSLELEVNSKFDPYDNIQNIVFGTKKGVDIEGNRIIKKKRDYTITYVFKDKTRPMNIAVRDTQAPHLEVKDKKVDLQTEITPELFVKKVSDDSKYELSFEKEPDPDRVGEQKLKVVAQDAYGNSTKKEVVLNRMKDEKPPTFKKVKGIEVMQGSSDDVRSKIKVEDDLDPEPKVEVDTNPIDMYTPGTYTVTATATDRSGNSTDQSLEIEVVENPEYSEKVVYLTFDDGPSENTKEILDILKKNKVKATFFVTGYDDTHREYIKEAYDQGHTIGLHTYSHDYASVYSSTDAYFADLKAVSDMVEEITGEKSTIIRFPGGSSNSISANYSVGIMSKLVDMVTEKGYQYFDWNVSSGDAEGNNIPKEQIIEMSCTDELNHINLLFHDSSPKDTTVEALDSIIQFYKDHGYKFYPLTHDSYICHHGTTN